MSKLGIELLLFHDLDITGRDFSRRKFANLDRYRYILELMKKNY